ncbi:MAG: XkdW family protein [Burkholderia sp.]
MNLATSIKYLFPGAEFPKDFSIYNDGDKTVIEFWGLSAPQPSLDDLVAAYPAAKLAEDKANKWERIKTERDRRKSGGFKVKVGGSNKWFHSDADSRIQHLGLKDKARDLIAGGGAMTDKLTILGQTVKWKTMDGSFVDVSAQVAFDIVAAAGDLDAQLFAAAETHKAAMEASADPASYDFSAGWPKSFGE